MTSTKQYAVYLMTNNGNSVIYCGVTSDLARRVHDHKRGLGGIFTRKYNITKLVHFEVTDDVSAAIVREKQIKAGSRARKIALIESKNPQWKDLSEEVG